MLQYEDIATDFRIVGETVNAFFGEPILETPGASLNRSSSIEELRRRCVRMALPGLVRRTLPTMAWLDGLFDLAGRYAIPAACETVTEAERNEVLLAFQESNERLGALIDKSLGDAYFVTGRADAGSESRLDGYRMRATPADGGPGMHQIRK